MSSHLARLKEELDAKQHELQEQQSTVASIEKLTRELEAQKKALADKAAELDTRQNEVTAMQYRLEALAAVESAIDHAIGINGRTRSDNLGDFLMDLIVDESSLEAAIDAAIQTLGVDDAVKHILTAVIGHGLNPHHLVDCIKKIMETVAAEKPAVMDSWGCAKENQGQ